MIAGQSNGNCVRRGFSTMRVVLGYENEFFLQEHPGKIDNAVDMIAEAGKWFPDHYVYVYVNDDGTEFVHESNVTVIPTLDFGLPGKAMDHFLWGFVYGSGPRWHFVVGNLVSYGRMQIGLIMGVIMGGNDG